tara:strand:- start:72 stop:1124 length:1053 start_codon:yes stop_codon:yes gene_type:complete
MKLREKIIEIIAKLFKVEESSINDQTSFVDDLGADSLDTVELVMAFEEEFGSEISDSEAEKILTVGDAIKFIQSHVTVITALNIPQTEDPSLLAQSLLQIKKEIERLKDKFIKQKEQLFSIVRTSKKKEVIKLEDGYVEVYVDKEGNPTRTYYSLDVEKLKKLPKEDFDKIRKRNLWFTREVYRIHKKNYEALDERDPDKIKLSNIVRKSQKSSSSVYVFPKIKKISNIIRLSEIREKRKKLEPQIDQASFEMKENEKAENFEAAAQEVFHTLPVSRDEVIDEEGDSFEPFSIGWIHEISVNDYFELIGEIWEEVKKKQLETAESYYKLIMDRVPDDCYLNPESYLDSIY